MKLDDLGRRAAAEIREATRQARFSAEAPGSRRPLWARPLVALGAAAAVLAVGIPLLLLYGPGVGPVTDGSTTTLLVTTTTAVTTSTEAPTTTTEAPTTTTEAPAKTPMPTVDELVAAIHAAVNAKDSDAVRALTAEDAGHPVYIVEGKVGTVSTEITPDYDWSRDLMLGIEVLGESFVSGNVVVTPVRVTYPDPDGALTGFDVIVVRHVEGGLLVGGAATFLADDRPDLVADPAEAQALIEASAAAFNADDVEGVLATMSGSAVLWPDMTDTETYLRGTSALREAITASLWFGVEYTGEPVMSGRFIAVPSRNTDDLGPFYDGVYLFWISDGKIALQAWAQGL